MVLRRKNWRKICETSSCHIVNALIRQKLFMEYDTVTSDKAYELAISMEAAEVNAVLVDDCSRVRNGDSVPVSSTTSVHLVGESKTRGDSSVEHWRLGHARNTVCFSGRSWWRRSKWHVRNELHKLVKRVANK